MNDIKIIYDAIQNSKGGVSFFAALGVMEPDIYVNNGVFYELKDIDLLNPNEYHALYKKEKINPFIKEKIRDDLYHIDLQNSIAVSSIYHDSDGNIGMYCLTGDSLTGDLGMIGDEEYIYIHPEMI